MNVRHCFWVAVTLVAGLAGCSGQKPGAAAGGVESVPEITVFVVPAVEPPGRPLRFPSTLSVEHEADLLAEEQGRLIEVLADQGQLVKRGQVLARIDDSRLQKQLEQDRAQKQMLEAHWHQAEVLREGAEVELKRQSELRQADLGSQRDFDRARFSLEGMRQEVVKARYDFERIRALVEDGEIRLSRMSLTAPFDGMVTRRYARIGEMLLRNAKVLRVTELRPLMVRFTLPESLRHATKDGSLIEVFPVDSASSALRARVIRTGFVVDAASGSVDCTARMLEPLPAKLVPGMAVEVQVPPSSAAAGESAVWVPVGSVRRLPGGQAELFALRGDRLEKRNVTLGRETLARIQVLKGVVPGERIVEQMSNQLHDGEQVRIRP